jgi:hypothetical protein
LPATLVVVRESDHRHVGAARDRRDRADVVGEQRAEDQAVALGERLRSPRPPRRRARCRRR